MLTLIRKIFAFRLSRLSRISRRATVPTTEPTGMIIVTLIDDTVIRVDAPARMIRGLVQQAVTRTDVMHTYFQLPLPE